MRALKFCKVLSLVLCLCLLFSCGTASQKGEKEPYMSFTDSLGRQVVLEKKPTRVAVLFSSFAHIWELSGGTVDITVYESIERGFGKESAILVDGGAGKNINCELLIASMPDLVIASADIDSQLKCKELLEAANIPCAFFRVESLEDYLSMLLVCTRINENEQAYSVYGEAVKERSLEIIARAPKGEPKRILFIRAASTVKSTKAKNADNNFVCAMLDDLGCHNIADSERVLLDGLSEEEIIKNDPEYIFISLMGDEAAAIENMEKILASQAYQSLDAVKNGRVYYLPKDVFQYKPTDSWDLAYEYLFELLYGKQD